MPLLSVRAAGQLFFSEVLENHAIQEKKLVAFFIENVWFAGKFQKQGIFTISDVPHAFPTLLDVRKSGPLPGRRPVSIRPCHALPRRQEDEIDKSGKAEEVKKGGDLLVRMIRRPSNARKCEPIEDNRRQVGYKHGPATHSQVMPALDVDGQ